MTSIGLEIPSTCHLMCNSMSSIVPSHLAAMETRLTGQAEFEMCTLLFCKNVSALYEMKIRVLWIGSHKVYEKKKTIYERLTFIWFCILGLRFNTLWRHSVDQIYSFDHFHWIMPSFFGIFWVEIHLLWLHTFTQSGVVIFIGRQKSTRNVTNFVCSKWIAKWKASL